MKINFNQSQPLGPAVSLSIFIPRLGIDSNLKNAKIEVKGGKWRREMFLSFL
jgi:hypothetical protein